MSSSNFNAAIGIIRQVTSEDDERTGMFIALMTNDRKRRQALIEWLLELEERDDSRT